MHEVLVNRLGGREKCGYRGRKTKMQQQSGLAKMVPGVQCTGSIVADASKEIR